MFGPWRFQKFLDDVAWVSGKQLDKEREQHRSGQEQCAVEQQTPQNGALNGGVDIVLRAFLQGGNSNKGLLIA